MENLFNEHLEQAALFLQENATEKALKHYKEALFLTKKPQQKRDLYRVLGRLYQKEKQPEPATDMFEMALKFHARNTSIETIADTAAIHNNLGALYYSTDPNNTIDHYSKALSLYTELTDAGNIRFLPHLANTHNALAETYTKKNKFYFAKKHFKAVISICDGFTDNGFEALKANAFYTLGNIYTEEFNLHDAKVNYLKALKIFETLAQKNPAYFQPYVASVYNNLGVTFKSLKEYQIALEYYQKALEQYLDLTENSTTKFLPYLAANYSSMGILYAEFRDLEKALQYLNRSKEIYEELTESKPQEYRHYLATALHNLGLFYFELKQIDPAEQHFLNALKMRKNLAYKEPAVFNADVCATSLNLVELYQLKIETSLDLSYKKIALDLLSDVASRLSTMDAELPVQNTMSSDCSYYQNYFENLTHEQLLSQRTLRQVDVLIKDINSTQVPAEKLNFQLEIVSLLEAVLDQYPENVKIAHELVNAYNDLSWLYIRVKDFKKAETTALKAAAMDLPILPLTCNLAHSYLLQDQFESSRDLYLEFLKNKRGSEAPQEASILKDFQILTQDGIYHEDFERIKALIQV